MGCLTNCDAAMFKGPKCFAQHALGTIHQVRQTLSLIGREQIALMWMRKKGQKEKMDDSVDISLALERIDLFVDLWEVQPCLWDPE